MKQLLTLFLVAGTLAVQDASAFCGFYVAKADAKLFNESSQIIMVRNGNQTTITMANDFKGEVKDFAMVVPVPVVLAEADIKVVQSVLFDKFDAYSAPRMAEYYDNNPCYVPELLYDYDMAVPSMAEGSMSINELEEEAIDPYQVTIEATYSVGEYDILILSAKESDGLKRWLTDNGYKIPEGAEEVLDPYIKSNMKFFVVKVNLDRMEKSGFTALNPIQIRFESEKFMLPIRLGMANSKGTQDMIVYAFTKTGRLETTNYRTVKMPTDVDVPEFVADRFGEFYKDVFTKKWKQEGQKAVMLEYAWDLSSSNYVHCDPCSSTPPLLADMTEAGVDWLSNQRQGTSQYTGDAFFTRLHVRYDRAHFAQDLTFQETPNKEQFQCRYVMRHPATGDLNCDAGQEYLKTVVIRRQEELKTLRRLTGWNISEYKSYVSNFSKRLRNTRVVEIPMPLPEKEKLTLDTVGVLPDNDTLVIDNSNNNTPDPIDTSNSTINTNKVDPKGNANPDESSSGNGWWYALAGGLLALGGFLAAKFINRGGSNSNDKPLIK